ncbi:MAG: DUF3090 family protein [Actinomycetota bacterium]|nr:DUF3090 family protein [Actinomycetota bacterium]
MSESFMFDEPRLFTVGFVGEPGHRMFFLQAHGDGTTVSIKCEKQQAGGLADFLTTILADLPPAGEDEPPPLTEALVPLEMAWIAGTMTVGYDEVSDRVLLVVEEVVVEADEEGGEPLSLDEPASLRVRLTRGQVAAYIAHALELVAAGRPPCRLCGQPIDSEGHVCPRLN